MSNALEASGRLVELIYASDDLANFGQGCDADTLIAAERDLGVKFPPSFRRLIEEFGTWDLAGAEFLGVYRTPSMGERLLGCVHETLDARRRYGMPTDLIAVMFDGMGGIIALDASRVDSDGEFPVVVWNPEVARKEDLEAVGRDFGSFALSVCRRALSA